MDEDGVFPVMEASAFPYLRENALAAWRVERLLVGAPLEPDAPEAAHELARLLAALRAPAHPGELAGEQAAVREFRQAALARRAPRQRGHLRPLPRRLAPKAAVAAMVGVFAISSVAAAAVTGSLPGPVQRFAHDAFGVQEKGGASGSGGGRHATAPAHPSTVQSRPAPSGGATGPQPTASPSHPASAAPTHGSAVGPNPAGPAAAGLCRAFAASKSNGNGTSVAARNLQAAAAAAGQTVDAYCAKYLAAGKPGKGTAAPKGKPSPSKSKGPHKISH